MILSSLTLIVTNDCNFSCQYCYQQHRQDYMDYTTAEKALNFFLPYLSKNYHLNFYGGEPLLAYPLIKETVPFLERKNGGHDKRPFYSITTNGSLLSDEMLQFFNAHKFSMEISFDGLAQELQRQGENSDKVIESILKTLDYPDIQIEVNSVFAPNTIGCLSESMEYLMDIGVPNIRYSFDTIKKWDQKAFEILENELDKLKNIAIDHIREHKLNPIANLSESQTKGLFHCNAGKDRLAISPDGQIWGCCLFPDYFRGNDNSLDFSKYSFGNIDSFVENHGEIYSEISSNYSNLSMNNFSTPKTECLFCTNLAYCRVCPITAALSGEEIGRIPDHLCAIKRIQIEAIKRRLL